MGPRPGGRGEEPPRSARGAAAMCFNGAAPRRARRESTAAQPRSRRDRFNGAAPRRARRAGSAPGANRPRGASMGPRPGGRGESAVSGVPSSVDRLQWGRAPEGAERSARTTTCWCHHRASMGPRPGGRGELGLAAITRNAPCASMGPRPGGRGEDRARIGASGTTMLQWGRAPEGAERCRKGVGPYSSAIASMGPRPGGRGESSYRTDWR